MAVLQKRREHCSIGGSAVRLGKYHLFVNYETLGVQGKLNIEPKCIIYLSCERCYMILQCYLNAIDIYLHYLLAIKMTFLKFILICTFKEPNLAKKGQIWRKICLKVELRGVHGVRFFQVCLQYIMVYFR